jgi:glycolate oxidase iron-sulfur subunit
VHCGFCLSACPTYLATGDESDGPRGRIVLMRALERGELAPDDPGLVEHLEACLGCRGCEPVCPSGVGYGEGLAAARAVLGRANRLSLRARVALGLFARPSRWRAATAAARWLRRTRLTKPLVGPGRLGFLCGLLEATRPVHPRRPPGHQPPSRPPAALPGQASGADGTVALFRGCVMQGLFGHVHEATLRTLRANGYDVIEVEGQACCGALHEHAGDRPGALALARRNVEAFEPSRADWVVVNSAGCGALLKDLGHLSEDPRAAALAGRIRDVAELLAARGPRPGAPLDLEIAYDAPCHLQHAQHVHEQPLAVLRAVPGMRLRLLPGFDRCCGSAGLYGVLHPELSRKVLADKLATLRDTTPRPDFVATGNPGCVMQIGAGLRSEGLPIGVVHPVELLDWSYQRAGYYS